MDSPREFLSLTEMAAAFGLPPLWLGREIERCPRRELYQYLVNLDHSAREILAGRATP